MQTRTGSFPIGFRRGRSKWQSDPKTLAAWAAANEITVIDLGTDAPDSLPVFVDAGMRIGSIDTLGYQGCVSIELEDANFNGTTQGEQFGILQGARFLAGC